MTDLKTTLEGVKVVDPTLVDWLTSVTDHVTARRAPAQLVTRYSAVTPIDTWLTPQVQVADVPANAAPDLVLLAGGSSPLSPEGRRAARRALAALGRVASAEVTDAVIREIGSAQEEAKKEWAIVLGTTARTGDSVYRRLDTRAGGHLALSEPPRFLALAALSGADFESRSLATDHRATLLGRVSKPARGTSEDDQLVRYAVWLGLSRTLPSGKKDFAGFLGRNQTEGIHRELGREASRTLGLIASYDALGDERDSWRAGLRALRQHLEVERARNAGPKRKFWTGSWQEAVLARVVEVLGI